MTTALVATGWSAIIASVPYFTIKSICTRISNYKILDAHLRSNEEEIKAIQTSITSDLYQLMTEGCFLREETRIVEELSIEIISNHQNFIFSLKNHPKYVIKSSRIGLRMEVSRFTNSMGCGLSYTATNYEGGVSPCFFALAERVAFSQRLRHIIKKHNLHMIKVPKKYLVSYPNHLVPHVSMPLQNKRVFVISKRYLLNPLSRIPLNETEQIELVKQLSKFFEKAKGILDTHFDNFCFSGKKLLFFDTEKFHLDPFCVICVSTPLKAARIGLRNIRNRFLNEPDRSGEKIASLCSEAIIEIRKRELAILITRIGVSIILFSLAYVALQYLLFDFSNHISK